MSITFTHPHIETNIFDNSQVTPATNNTDVPTLFQPYYSERGTSDKIELMASLSEFLDEKGLPNYKKYGPFSYNIVNWLANGGRVLGVRLAPENSTYAYLALDFVLKVPKGSTTDTDTDTDTESTDTETTDTDTETTDTETTDTDTETTDTESTDTETTDTETTDTDTESTDTETTDTDTDRIASGSGDDELPVVEVKVVQLDGGIKNSKKSDILAAMIDKENALNEEDSQNPDYTIKHHLISTYLADGVGTYGNNYSLKITQNTGYDKTYGFRSYSISLFETDADGTVRLVEGPAGFSFYPEAISAGNLSLVADSIVSRYFDDLICIYSEDSYDTLIDDIMDLDLGISDEKLIDILYDENTYVNDQGETEYFFRVDTSSLNGLVTTTSANVYQGQNLVGGSNGSLENKKYISSKDSDFQTEANKTFKEIYEGKKYPEITDKTRYYIDVVLDSELNVDVKKAMYDFVTDRGDCVLLVDTNVTSTATYSETANETVNWFNSNLAEYMRTEMNSYLASAWGQRVTLYDPYSASNISVSPLFYVSQLIPAVDLAYGPQETFVGPNRGIIDDTNFLEVNYYPTESEKTKLYDNRINYIESSYRDIRFGTQSTIQSKTTSLSDINHVRTLLKIVRSVEELCERYIFENANDNILASINNELATTLSTWVTNGTCTVCTGKCTQTELEAENKTAHVTLEVIFIDVIEKIIIDVNVGR